MNKKRQRIVSDPVGRCIYCGATECDLSMEHVVPFGLNGDLELPDASCADCAEITSKVEMFALRQTFPYLRSRYNLKTRRPKERKTQFELFITPPNGTTETIQIPASDLPVHLWVMPIYPEYPGLTCDRAIDEQPSAGGNQCSIGVEDVKRLLAKYGYGRGTNMVINIGVIEGIRFSRMLAKIAHAFAHAAVGEAGFIPVLPQFILSGRPEQPNHFVGLDPSIPADSGMWQKGNSICQLELCHITSPSSILFLCAKIRLFSFLGTPGLIVVIGESLTDEDSVQRSLRYEVPMNGALE